MKKLIPFASFVVAAVILLVVFTLAQSSLKLSPGGLLSGCAVSGAGELSICNVANDPANPAGMYISANGQPYFLVTQQVNQTLNFSQIQGQTTGKQIGNMSCTVAGTINSTTQTMTFTNCQ